MLDRDTVARALQYVADAGAWREQARPEQQPPAVWRRTWYLRGGRGSGKTWAGSNTLAELIRLHPADDNGTPTEWAVVAPTYADSRDTCVEGPSGLLKALGLPRTYAGWNRSMGQLVLASGQIVYVGSADDGALRVQGKNLAGCWSDEIGLWKQWQTAWDESIAYAVRIEPALIIATGTPKRNRSAKALVRRLLDDVGTPVSTLRSADNAHNLAPSFWEALSSQAGTTLGRQELEGELLDDVEGALWSAGLLVHAAAPAGPALRTVVSVDPSGSAGGDATGIVALAQHRDHLRVLADATLNAGPEARAEAACRLAYRLGAGEFVVEGNYGGDLFAAQLRSSWRRLVEQQTVIGPCPSVHTVTARGSKADRAMVVVQAYEQALVLHAPDPAVAGPDGLTALEEEMTSWTPDESWSPNRLDALVHGVRRLLPSLQQGASVAVSPAAAALPRVGGATAGPRITGRVR